MSRLPWLFALVITAGSASAAAAQGVHVTTLAAPDAFTTPGRDTGLPADLWRGASVQTAKTVLPLLATGGGAFMNEQTRALIKSKAVSVWLKADLEILARRVSRKDTRPLLAGKDPLMVLQGLAETRYPVYAQADIAVESGDAAHHVTVEQVIEALFAFIAESAA